MPGTHRIRRDSTRLFVLVAMVATTLGFAPTAPAQDDASGASVVSVASSAYDMVQPRHESPGGCNSGGGANGGMGAFLQVTKVKVRRGDTNALIGSFTLPSFTSDISEGDKVVVTEMKLTNPSGCDVSNATLTVAVYQDGSGYPGTAVASQQVATGVSISSGGAAQFFAPNFSFFVGATTHDVGDEFLGGGDPAGEQFAIVGIVDAGYDPGAGLHDMDFCGAAGSLHNGTIDGSGCSVFANLFTVNDPAITVDKKAFKWNKVNPKVFVSNGQVKIHGKFYVDGESIVAPGKTVYYLYQVINIGPINDLVPGLLADDQCSPISQATDGTLIGDDNNDGELDVGEAWYFLCHRSYTLTGVPSMVVQNNASFIFEDRNGNETDTAADDFTIIIGYTCFGKLATIVGTNGPEVLNGTPGKDVIYARNGNDVINGGGGGDRICAGGGDDEVHGGGGKDKINGQAGDDTLNGDGKGDTIKGGGGDDILNGGKGGDKLTGNGGFDTANGGAGADTCNAEVMNSC